MTFQTSSDTTKQTIKVWDPLVRGFHWLLVLSFFIAYVTEDELLIIHSYAGYLILSLILIRIIWGFLGTKHARFSNFIYSPSIIRQFIKDTFQFKAKRYLGHNPAGGAMILILLLSLILCTLSGIVVYAIEEQAGPLVGLINVESHFWREAIEESHEFFANFIVLLIVIHLVGVLGESFLQQENLVKSMFDGNKLKEKE